MLTRDLAHDVSILPGGGRHLGTQRRAKSSITIIRAPQFGLGQRSTRGASGVLSGCFCGSAAGGATPSSYYVFIKIAEIARFQMEVTEWEQAEYFDIF